MAGASDKARFFLEQSVPELQELERKKIFTKEEITSISKKRSDFEHKINARGSHPSDFARYVEFEINLESLRRKRVKRLGIKTSGHAGHRRIFFVLERATRKFYGDVGLWMQYIEFARKEKANRKLLQILTSVLRLHPTRPELWIYAARYSMDSQADMTAARSYMQRGLRFCKNSKELWLEYAKLEMVYIAKIAARRQILGLDRTRSPTNQDPSRQKSDEDMIELPEITAEDINPSLKGDRSVDETTLQTLDSTPALTGAIPIAIFDAGMKQFQNSIDLGGRFFDMFVEFEKVPCLQTILQHVVDKLLVAAPTSTLALVPWIRQPAVGIEVTSVKFPSAVAICLERLKSSLHNSVETATLALKIIDWLWPFLSNEELDPSIHKVLSAKLRKNIRAFEQAVKAEGGADGNEVADVVGRLHQAGMLSEAGTLKAGSLGFCDSNQVLWAAQVALKRND
ncbi:MAG: U3 snoRNP protein [Pycnora praestabilis]|nr:MAG: U3 snoRNP protein [Pycnora praestabilis]